MQRCCGGQKRGKKERLEKASEGGQSERQQGQRQGSRVWQRLD